MRPLSAEARAWVETWEPRGGWKRFGASVVVTPAYLSPLLTAMGEDGLFVVLAMPQGE